MTTYTMLAMRPNIPHVMRNAQVTRRLGTPRMLRVPRATMVEMRSMRRAMLNCQVVIPNSIGRQNEFNTYCENTTNETSLPNLCRCFEPTFGR